MKKLSLLTKSLLVVAGLLMGTMSAWADVEETVVVNCNFDNGETLFTDASRMTITNDNNVKFTCAGNSQNGYSLATYNFSSAIGTDATAVKIEFLFWIPNENAAYRRFFTVGQADLRTGFGKTSYSTAGSMFAFGLARNSSANYFSINGASTTAAASAGSVLGAWARAEIYVDHTSKKVNYKITNVENTTTYYSADNVAFVDGSASYCNQLDFFDCQNNIISYLDNLVITKYVDSSKINYTLNAVDEEDNVLTTLSSGWATSGDEVPYSKYLYANGMWYETSSPYVKAITSADNKVVYAPSKIAYFYEFETLSRSGGSATVTETGTAYSNNTVGRIANSKSAYATLSTPALSAGKYTLSMPYFCGNSISDEDKIYVYVTSDISSLGEPVETFDIQKRNDGNFTGEITVPEGNYVAFQGAKSFSHNSKARIDYITLTPAPIEGTIATSGYSSLASKYVLDFKGATVSTGTLTAYVVSSITKDAVTLTSVDELPANQGVILKGTPGATYSIPVKATAAAPATNLLKAAVTATDITANQTYILQGGKFCLVTEASTVPAGKAYLLASDVPATARALDFAFGDGTTGINSVQGSGLKVNGSENFYNLQGQRVAQPGKGLYIVNGKKVIVK